jgi:hypothetical protein
MTTLCDSVPKLRATLWFTVFVFFSLTACQKKETIPPDILKPAQMQSVLWDMMRADQFVQQFIALKDTTINADDKSLELYSEIFAIHKISKEEFVRSFNYYNTHPKLLRPLMDSISTRRFASDSIGPAPRPALDTMKPGIRPRRINVDSLMKGTRRSPRTQ